MKINYIKEGYFKDITVRQKDDKSTLDKVVEGARAVMTEKIKSFLVNWFLDNYDKYSSAMSGNCIFLLNIQTETYEKSEIAENKNILLEAIDHIDFDTKTLYYNIILTNAGRPPVHGNLIEILLTSEDKGPLSLMQVFEYDFKNQFPGFSVKFVPKVKDFLGDDITRPDNIRFTFANNFTDNDYEYIQKFFRFFDTLTVSVIIASIYDNNFYRFLKDFKYNERFNHSLNSINLMYNTNLETSNIGVTFAMLKDKNSVDNFNKTILAGINSKYRELEKGEDYWKGHKDEKVHLLTVELPILEKLSKIKFERLLKN